MHVSPELKSRGKLTGKEGKRLVTNHPDLPLIKFVLNGIKNHYRLMDINNQSKHRFHGYS